MKKSLNLRIMIKTALLAFTFGLCLIQPEIHVSAAETRTDLSSTGSIVYQNAGAASAAIYAEDIAFLKEKLGRVRAEIYDPVSYRDASQRQYVNRSLYCEPYGNYLIEASEEYSAAPEELPETVTPAAVEDEPKIDTVTPTPTEEEAETDTETPAPTEDEAETDTETPAPAEDEAETDIEAPAENESGTDTETPAESEPEGGTVTPAPTENEPETDTETSLPAESKQESEAEIPTPAKKEPETDTETRPPVEEEAEAPAPQEKTTENKGGEPE